MSTVLFAYKCHLYDLVEKDELGVEWELSREYSSFI